jgi:hypothetical protein
MGPEAIKFLSPGCNNQPKVGIYRTKNAAPFYLKRPFLILVDRRIELSNFIHNDLEALEEFLDWC